MDDQFDVRLTDDDLLTEIELMADLIVAAAASDGPLSQAQVDAMLGVKPREARLDDGEDPPS